MLVFRTLQKAFVLVLLPFLTACDLECYIFNCQNGSSTSDYPATAVQYPAVFWTAAVNNPYNCATIYGGDFDNSQTQNDIADADSFAVLAKNQAGYTQYARLLDSNVSASSMTLYNQLADAMYYSGHGDFGLAVFGDCSLWGPGSVDGYFTANPAGLPVGGSNVGNLKWMMLSSSNTAAGPPNAVPLSSQALRNRYSANWNGAFGHGLHGIYGGWQPPNSGLADIGGYVFGQSFGILAITGCNACIGISSNSQTVHDSWKGALTSTQDNVGWAIWEDSNASSDHLSGREPSNGSAPAAYASSLSGNVQFYDNQNANGIATQSVTPDNSTFTVVPYSLANQSVDHTSLYNQFASQSATTPTVVDDGVTYTVQSSAGLLSHEYGLSGAVVYVTASLLNPMTISQSTALSAAQTFATNTLGMPSDAVLANTFGLWDTDISSGNQTLTGYEFTFQHASGNIGGGDAIIIDVNDLTTYSQGTTCIDWEYTDPDPPQHPHRYCAEFNEIVSHTPYISYAYDLWRTTPSQINGQSAGQTSITAQAAAGYVDPNATINGFAQGYWTPLVGSPSTLATPAWVFYVNSHTQVFVDAYYGGILGATQVE
jgi:hypothetical protein